ncbi:MAG: hypothetical protein ACLS36_02100 [Streptococcus sp.]
MIATHGKELISLAQDKGSGFHYEALLLVVFHLRTLQLFDV